MTNNQKFVDVSYFLLRVVAGLLFLQHGGRLLLGWFGGMPVEMTPLLYTAGVLALVGGALVLAGLFTRPVAFILSGFMAVAYFKGHFPEAFWPIENGGEVSALYAFIFLFISAYGAGKWSLDSKLRKSQ